MDAIERGEAKAVVIGATDPPPNPLSVGAFYSARVVAADGNVSKPLTGMRGTHVAGGSVLWILGDLEHMRAQGFKPLGMEPLARGGQLGRRPHHHAVRRGPDRGHPPGLRQSGVRPDEIATWDLHATAATPGDYQEVHNLRSVVPETRAGHRPQGNLRPRHVGRRRLGADRAVPRLRAGPPVPDAARARRAEPADRRACTATSSTTSPCAAPAGPAGKLSMGVGGINACVISRPWEDT